MNESSQIVSPTLAFFLYDIREELGQDPSHIQQNRHRFWRKIEPKLDRDYSALGEEERLWLDKLEAIEKPEAREIELLARITDRRFSSSYYALQMGDTYALRVESFDPIDRGMQSLEILPQLKRKVAFHINHQLDSTELQEGKNATIAQTWLLWGRLPGNHLTAHQVAKACCEQLFPNETGNTDRFQQGKLAGASLYEWWQPPTEWHNLGRENWHQLVMLFSPRQSVEDMRSTINTLYPHLMRLFCHRNKILWAYACSRQTKSRLQADYRSIETLSRDLQTTLKHPPISIRQWQNWLAQTLELSSRYARQLSDLAHQERMIQTSLLNYHSALGKIAEVDADSQLEFLSEFGNSIAENYRLKIEMEIAYFNSGLIELGAISTALHSTISQSRDVPNPQPSSFLVAVAMGVVASLVASPLLAEALSIGWSILSLPIGFAVATIAFVLLRKP
ncbi:MAG: hypothetical protein WBB29_03030 [Geitlerinemataceae cyanobacterium]